MCSCTLSTMYYSGIPYRCETDDTAQYTAVASNIHGQVSTQASVIVKSKFGKANIQYISFVKGLIFMIWLI